MSWHKVVSCFSLAVVSLAPALVLPTSVDAQDLFDRSRIELKLGLGMRANSGTSTSLQGVETDTDASGMLGSIGYNKWIREEIAVTFSFGLLAVDVGTSVGSSGVETSTSLVMPAFLGVRYYMPASTYGGQFRPYVSAEGGPLIGFDTETEVGNVVQSGSSTAATIGARVGGGVDILAGNRFMIDLFGGYDLMADFGEPIGGQKNHSGWEFGVGFGVVWGGEGD